MREQIQEDIMTYMDDKMSGYAKQTTIDDLCQIVVENFNNYPKAFQEETRDEFWAKLDDGQKYNA